MRLWPRSLAVRLTLLLVATLALAQLGLTLLLSRERDSVVEDLMHSQALSQSVTLARLLDQAPPADADLLLQAFRSRRSCVAIEASASAGPMSPAEQQLAQALASMLHGIGVGTPRVTLSSGTGDNPGCGSDGLHADDDHSGRGHADNEPEVTALNVEVPLLDGRWLVMRTAVNLPDEPNRLALVSFVVSALAVGLVTIWAVRGQTRQLRALAEASERFGRGEQVEPLPLSGPSEVTAATRAFNTMQQRLSQFIAERMRLLAGISHDLRTPLTTLRLKAELLEDATARDDLIATIDELSRISEATLAFTRAEAANEETVPLDLAELLGELIGEFQLNGADVAGSRIESTVAPCRPVALKRAVRNLVENAVRYGGSARLNLYRAGDEAVIEVTDTGPGIPPDRIVDAFKPFVRLEPSRNAETGGIGLGLAIAQGIVHAHGGSIDLANRATGKGLVARIRLPIATSRPGSIKRKLV
ncbi:MAG: HAMP domain-containing protein [Devosia sp.]|uniref:ATP-binding protein n=1 Tax=Devosia sp. TaxID=1871048 RepID=UPI001AC8BD80|nr:ATP-binding protein [Devosia sp.]MBN9315710.1 HAMP domain-containing protein [Devosia sp.]